MARVTEFRDRNQLIQEQKRKSKGLAAWFRSRRNTIDEIVLSSVGSNTFRAFHKMPQKPSQVFRGWASSRLHDPETLDELLASKVSETAGRPITPPR